MKEGQLTATEEPSSQLHLWWLLLAGLALLSTGQQHYALLAAAAAVLSVPVTVGVVLQASAPRLLIPSSVLIPAATIGLLGIIQGGYFVVDHPHLTRFEWVIRLHGLAGLLVLTAVARRRSGGAAQPAVLTLAFTLIGSAAVMAALPPHVIDVTRFHIEATGAVGEGLNPYSDFSVPNGSPLAEPGETIDGYPYPLPALVPYVTAGWLLGEPRWASAAAWVVTIGVLVAAGWRRPRALPAAAFLAVLAGWPILLWGGFTEPLTVALFALAAAIWAQPLLSGILLGLALASKQYLVVLLPLLLLAPVPSRGKRTTAAISSAGLVTLAGLAYGGRGFLDAVIAFHLQQPPRPDSLNLTGLLISALDVPTPPGWLAPLLGITLAVVAARWARDVPRFFAVAAGVLAVTFLLGAQAFSNYWFLVLALLTIAVVIHDVDPTGRDDDSVLIEDTAPR